MKLILFIDSREVYKTELIDKVNSLCVNCSVVEVNGYGLPELHNSNITVAFGAEDIITFLTTLTQPHIIH